MNKLKEFLEKELKLKIFIVVLFGIIISGLIVIIYLHNAQLYRIAIGREVEFIEDSGQFTLYVVSDSERKQVLFGQLGVNIPAGLLPIDCLEEDNIEDDVCLEWKNKAHLNISHFNENKSSCYKVSWQSLSRDFTPKDCFELSYSHWYGGYNYGYSSIENSTVAYQPFTTSTINGNGAFGSVIHSYWLISTGVTIYVSPNDDPPLFVGINQTHDGEKYLCLSSTYANSPYHNYNNAFPHLTYYVCTAENLLDAHLSALKHIAKPPMVIPDLQHFTDPFFSTWAKFKDQISDELVLTYAQTVIKDGLPVGRLSIDNGWQNEFGNLVFNPTRFPNATATIQELHSMNFSVLVEVSPLCDIYSDSFLEAASLEYCVIDAGDAAPGLLQYWQGPQTDQWYHGYSCCTDMHNSSYQWFLNRLTTFIETFKVDGLSFGAGEVNRLPYHGHFHERYTNPNLYTYNLNQFEEDIKPWLPRTAAYKAQQHLAFIRLYDFNSTWSRDTYGIQAVIPVITSLGLMGYPFFIPDAIGGNNYSVPLTKELYIRWLQLTAFLPVMHFSVLPSDFDQETVTIAATYAKLHDEYVVPKLSNSLVDASEKLTPIIRPLWWADPLDENCHGVEDEFLVADVILVAPILIHSSRSRDIYIPSGHWIDKNSNTYITGPQLLLSYPANISIIPYFEKVNGFKYT